MTEGPREEPRPDRNPGWTGEPPPGPAPGGGPQFGQPYHGPAAGGDPRFPHAYPPPPPPQWGAPFPPPMAPPPNNHMVFAIITTVLCCLPLGIVSLVKASEVNAKWAGGQFAAARESAESARKFAMWGMIVGGVVILLAVILYVVLIVVAVNSDPYY